LKVIKAIIITQFGKFRGEANVEKHADTGKKNRNSRKSRENSRNLLEAFLRSRKEENLYGQCDTRIKPARLRTYAPRVRPPFKGFPLLRKLPHHIGSMDRQAPRVAHVVLNR